MSAISDAAAFSEQVGEEDIPPIRVSALVSVALGLLSILNLFVPAMIGVSAVAVVVALIALRPSKSPVAGKKAAVFGMALATFFGSWGYAQQRTLENENTEMLKALALNWLDSFNYDVIEVTYEMTLTDKYRRFGKLDLRKHYRHQKVRPEFVDESSEAAMREAMEENEGLVSVSSSFKEFLKNDAIDKLRNAPSKPQWEYVGIVESSDSYKYKQRKLRFRDANDVIDQDLDLEMEADGLGKLYDWQWRISSYRFL